MNYVSNKQIPKGSPIFQFVCSDAFRRLMITVDDDWNSRYSVFVDILSQKNKKNPFFFAKCIFYIASILANTLMFDKMKSSTEIYFLDASYNKKPDETVYFLHEYEISIIFNEIEHLLSANMNDDDNIEILSNVIYAAGKFIANNKKNCDDKSYMEFVNYYILKMMNFKSNDPIDEIIKKVHYANENENKKNYECLFNGKTQRQRSINMDNVKKGITSSSLSYKIELFHRYQVLFMKLHVIYEKYKNYTKKQLPRLENIDEKYNVEFCQNLYNDIHEEVNKTLNHYKKVLDAYFYKETNWYLINFDDFISIIADDHKKSEEVVEIEEELLTFESFDEIGETKEESTLSNLMSDAIKSALNTNGETKNQIIKYIAEKKQIPSSEIVNMLLRDKKKESDIETAQRYALTGYIFDTLNSQKDIKLFENWAQSVDKLGEMRYQRKVLNAIGSNKIKVKLLKAKNRKVNEKTSNMSDITYSQYLDAEIQKSETGKKKLEYFMKILSFICDDMNTHSGDYDGDNYDNMTVRLSKLKNRYDKIDKSNRNIPKSSKIFIQRYNLISTLEEVANIIKELITVDDLTSNFTCVGVGKRLEEFKDDFFEYEDRMADSYNNPDDLFDECVFKHLNLDIFTKSCFEWQLFIDDFEYYNRGKKVSIADGKYYKLFYKDVVKLLCEPSYYLEMDIDNQGRAWRSIYKQSFQIKNVSVFDSGGIYNKKKLTNNLFNMGIFEPDRQPVLITSNKQQMHLINDECYVYNAGVLEELLSKIYPVNYENKTVIKSKSFNLNNIISVYDDVFDLLDQIKITNLNHLSFERDIILNGYKKEYSIKINTNINFIGCKIAECVLEKGERFSFFMNKQLYDSMNLQGITSDAYLHHYFVFARESSAGFIYDVYSYFPIDLNDLIETAATKIIQKLGEVLTNDYFDIIKLNTKILFLNICKYLFNIRCATHRIGADTKSIRDKIKGMINDKFFAYNLSNEENIRTSTQFNDIITVIIRNVCYYIDSVYQIALANCNFNYNKVAMFFDNPLYHLTRKGQPYYNDFGRQMIKISEICTYYGYKNPYHMLTLYKPEYGSNTKLLDALLKVNKKVFSPNLNSFDYLHVFVTPSGDSFLNIFKQIGIKFELSNKTQTDLDQITSNILGEKIPGTVGKTPKYVLNGSKEVKGVNLNNMVGMINNYICKFDKLCNNQFFDICEQLSKKNKIKCIWINEHRDITYVNISGNLSFVFDLLLYHGLWPFKHKKIKLYDDLLDDSNKLSYGGDIKQINNVSGVPMTIIYLFMSIIIILYFFYVFNQKSMKYQNMRYNIQNGQYVYAAPRFRANCASPR